jgi:hypothetical protein
VEHLEEPCSSTAVVSPMAQTACRSRQLLQRARLSIASEHDECVIPRHVHMTTVRRNCEIDRPATQPPRDGTPSRGRGGDAAIAAVELGERAVGRSTRSLSVGQAAEKRDRDRD